MSQTVGRLERDDLLTVCDDRHLELSETGWHRAQMVMRKHRLAECMLLEIIGMDWGDIHEEACRLEHVMSEQLEDRIAVLLKEPHFSPYGCPIPIKDGKDDPFRFRNGVATLSSRLGSQPKPFVLRRMSEFVQADYDALSALADIGLRPGKGFEAFIVGDAVEIRCADARVRIDRMLASGLWIDN